MLSDTQEEGAWFNFGGNAKKCVQTCWGKRTQQRLVAHGMLPMYEELHHHHGFHKSFLHIDSSIYPPVLDALQL